MRRWAQPFGLRSESLESWVKLGKRSRRDDRDGRYTAWYITGTGLENLLWVLNVEPASVNLGKRLRSATGLDFDDTF